MFTLLPGPPPAITFRFSWLSSDVCNIGTYWLLFVLPGPAAVQVQRSQVLQGSRCWALEPGKSNVLFPRPPCDLFGTSASSVMHWLRHCMTIKANHRGRGSYVVLSKEEEEKSKSCSSSIVYGSIKDSVGVWQVNCMDIVLRAPACN